MFGSTRTKVKKLRGKMQRVVPQGRASDYPSSAISRRNTRSSDKLFAGDGRTGECRMLSRRYRRRSILARLVRGHLIARGPLNPSYIHKDCPRANKQDGSPSPRPQKGPFTPKRWAERHMRASFFVLPFPSLLSIGFHVTDTNARTHARTHLATHTVADQSAQKCSSCVGAHACANAAAGATPRVFRLYIWQFPSIPPESSSQSNPRARCFVLRPRLHARSTTRSKQYGTLLFHYSGTVIRDVVLCRESCGESLRPRDFERDQTGPCVPSDSNRSARESQPTLWRSLALPEIVNGRFVAILVRSFNF